jgi:hypothetical protein
MPSNFFIQIAPFLVGAALLFFGRKIFWFFVGAVGFVVGGSFATRFFDASPEWALILIALGVGLVGALLAFVIQKFVVVLAGFAAGGFLLMNITESIGWQSEHFPWIVFVVGGIIGAILISKLFEWAVIVLSSILGAYLIVHQLHTNHTTEPYLLIIFTLFGILFQARNKRKSHPKKDDDKPEE